MGFEVSVRNREGNWMSWRDLQQCVIEKEGYYQKIREIDHRIEQMRRENGVRKTGRL